MMPLNQQTIQPALLKISLLLCIVLCYHGFQTAPLRHRPAALKPASSSPSSSLDRISFGERLELQLELVAGEGELHGFLCEPRRIIEQVWDASKVKDLGEGTYLLQFITIPVLDITPEIECIFVYKDNKVQMQSGNWRMIGSNSSKSKKDATFLDSFDIMLSGELVASPMRDSEKATPRGWINYSCSARKPRVFRTAPFLLPNTIDFIKFCVRDFVLQSFPTEFSRAYNKYRRSIDKGGSNMNSKESRDGDKWEAWETLEVYQLLNNEKKKILTKISENQLS